MEDNKNNEQWVNEAMDSLKGMHRIPASTGVYDGVMRRLSEKSADGGLSATIVFKRAAVAAILLLVINVASIIHSSRKTQTAPQQSVYQSVNDDISYLSDESY